MPAVSSIQEESDKLGAAPAVWNAGCEAVFTSTVNDLPSTQQHGTVAFLRDSNPSLPSK